MKKFGDEKLYIKVFTWLAMLLFAGLFTAGLVYTGTNPNVYDEFVNLKLNNPLVITATLLVSWLLLYGLNCLFDKVLYKINFRVFAYGFAAIGLVLSIVWALFAHCTPQADALSICNVASEVNNGTSGVYAFDSYVGVYSHQLGFVTIIRILFKLFGDNNYTAVQTVLAFCIPVIIISACESVKLILKGTDEKLSNKASFFTGLFAFTCIPMYMYVLFVYGDLPYTALTMLAFWLLLSCLEKRSFTKALLFGLVCAVEYMCKSNSLIVFISFAIVLLISLLAKEKRLSSLMLLVSMLLLVILIPKVNDKIYDPVMPHTDSMPSIAWVVMGMNDDYERAGWCNFYNQIVFAENGYEAEPTKAQCKDEIKAILGVWAHRPLYTLDFLNRKINLQWNTPMYQGVVMNNHFDRDSQKGIAYAVFNEEKTQRGLEGFMKGFQLMMYGSLFAVFLISIRKKAFAFGEKLSGYGLLIAVFGGFLFSVIWEAKTRYIFPYLIMSIPYMGMAVAKLLSAFTGREALGLKSESNVTIEKDAKYNGIDLFKIFMAVCVIAIHVVPYMYIENPFGVQVWESIIFCSVPFFFLVSGFFLGRKLWAENDAGKRTAIVKAYLWRILKLYLIWTAVYFPLAVSEYVRCHYSVGTSIFYYIRGLLFVGEHYNSWILWYLLSTIYMLLLLLLLIKLNVKTDTMVIGGAVLWIVSLFTQYVYEFELFNPQYQGLIKVLGLTFVTGKVFEGFLYFPLGLSLARKKPSMKLGIVLMILGFLVALTGKFSDIPIAVCSVGLFNIAASLKLKDGRLYPMLRGMSTVTYFTHMLVYTLVYMIMARTKIYGMKVFVITSIVTLLLSFAVTFLRQNKSNIFSKKHIDN